MFLGRNTSSEFSGNTYLIGKSTFHNHFKFNFFLQYVFCSYFLKLMYGYGLHCDIYIHSCPQILF